MSFILGGKKIEIPGLKTISWEDTEAILLGIKQVTDKNPRGKWLRAIVAHTIHGKLGKLLPGLGPNTDIDVRNARYQTNSVAKVSWDFTEDMDGSWLIQNDVLKNYSWQATDVNDITCGFEMVQHDNGDMYEKEIDKAVLFCDFATAMLGIQRQIPWNKKDNKAILGIVKRIEGPNCGKDVVGIYSHSNQTTNRGPGDCGPWLFNALKDAGYLLFDFDSNDDKEFWKKKQKELGIPEVECDGVPGKKTVASLKQNGKKHGILVPRPIDDLIS